MNAIDRNLIVIVLLASVLFFGLVPVPAESTTIISTIIGALCGALIPKEKGK